MTEDQKTAEILKPYRERIDALDERIVDLLVQRTAIIREVASLKFEHGIEAVLPERVEEVREHAASIALENGLSPDLMRALYTILIDYSCQLEEEMMADIAHSSKKVAGR